MSNPDQTQLIDDPDLYDPSKEDSLRSMISEFYSRRMRSIAILLWVMGLVLMAVAIIVAVLFFQAGAVKHQILYATIFLWCMSWFTMVKIFAWQTIYRNSIKREIKRLELRVAELAAAGEE